MESSGRILLIEHNKQDASFVSDMLNGKGYSVSCASSGKEGLSRLKKERFDLIILALSLPDIKGEELCSMLKRRRSGYRKLPVIILSIKDEIGDIEELFERGADDYIIKPPRQSHLLEKVSTYIARKKIRAR